MAVDLTSVRVLICGSVDDGKSTLIGRLLYDAGAVPSDVLSALEADSRRHGTVGDATDFALLVDGLSAEREQGITIDVAYRYFSTETRRFTFIDAPGHEQFTANMATGASTADVAVVLVDARQGILHQTRQHVFIGKAMGIRHFVLAVNKMDLVGWSRPVFDKIRTEFEAMCASGSATPHPAASSVSLPVAAIDGSNLVHAAGERCPWYSGPPLLEILTGINVDDDADAQPVRLGIQWVCRPNLDFRGYGGRITSGRLHQGQQVQIMPSGLTATIAAIGTPAGNATSAMAGQSVMVELEEDVSVGRGDWICAPETPMAVSDLLNATIFWMSSEPMYLERRYMFQCGAAVREAQVLRIRHRIDVATGAHLAARSVKQNEVVECEIVLSAPIAFDSYSHQTRDSGGFVLIDRLSGATIGAGLCHFPLRRASNINPRAYTVNAKARGDQKGQRGLCVWMTGLSGSGKSTLANALDDKLFDAGRHTYVIDGDNLRRGLNRDLGFTVEDRIENVRRIAEVARLFVDAGLIVIVAVISPFQSERESARDLFPENGFLEVFVDAPLDVCETRDPKGLYAKMRAGNITNFTGVSSPYEPPAKPDVHVKTAELSVSAGADLVYSAIKALM